MVWVHGTTVDEILVSFVEGIGNWKDLRYSKDPNQNESYDRNKKWAHSAGDIQIGRPEKT